MIRLTDYEEEITELAPGETTRVDHAGCPAGEDTRRRLYITRPQAKPDSIIAFCHNCQESGFNKKDSSYESYRREMHGQTPNANRDKVSDVVEPPPNLVFDVRAWPTPALTWLLSNKLTGTDVESFDIGYDPSSNRIYLPRYLTVHGNGPASTLQGYQLRKIVDSNSPKYLTCSTTDDKGFTFIESSSSPCRCVLVEDLVSGIHITKACPFTQVLVNYGVKTNLEALYSIKDTPILFVWLDNDSMLVENQAKAMLQTWNLLKDPRSKGAVVKDYSDPKHYTAGAIKLILRESVTWTT